MARKTGKIPIPTSIEMMPVLSQFAFLAMATWVMARDPSSIIYRELEEVRRPLRELGYTPLTWDPETAPLAPGYSLLTSEEEAMLDSLPFWNSWKGKQQADEWITRVLLSDPQRSRPIAWYTLQSNPRIKELAKRWFPPTMSFWASPFPATTSAELWVVFISAFVIEPSRVNLALQRAGSQLLSPIFYPQTLPVWQLIEGFFNIVHTQFNNQDITIDAVRQTFDEAEGHLRNTISQLDSRIPAIYLRITPALSKHEAEKTISDLYTTHLPVIWRNVPFNPTQRGNPPWWQVWEIITDRSRLYAEYHYNNLQLQDAAEQIHRYNADPKDLRKELNDFESILALAKNIISRGITV